MSWRITVGDLPPLDSDDMTVEELGEVERISGTPWSIANPLREVTVAKAFAAVVLLRSGVPEKEVPARLTTLTARDLKNAFEWVEDDAEAEGEHEEPDPSAPPPAPTTPASSPGARAGAGRRPSRAGSVSATS